MATAAEVQTAYKAINRVDLNATVAQATADAINNGTTTLDAYIASQLAATVSTTQAGVAISAFVTGLVPTSAKLDALKVAADAQVASYAAMGVGNPALGAYEAFGVGFSDTPEFAAKYGSVDGADYINAVYSAVYGNAPSAAAFANLSAQIDYFTNLYTSAGIDADVAVRQAKGAVLGQIVGYAFVSDASANSVLDNQVAAALTSAAKGDSTVYGATLPLGGGKVGLTYNSTVGLDNIVGTVDNDTINILSVNATTGADATTVIAADKFDGGAGIDTLNFYSTAGENPAILGTYSNIEIANFYGANNIGTIDATLIGGSQQIWIQSTGGATAVNGLSGKTLGVAGATTGTVTGNFGTATSATLALSGSTDGAGTGNAAVDIAGVATTLAISGAGKATVTDNGGGGDTIKTVTVRATGATTLDLSGLGLASTIDGSASTAALTLGALNAAATTVTTGSGNDSLTLTATAKATVNTGAGNDSVTLGSALAAGSSVNLGAGNDKLLFAAGGSVGATALVDGGEGTDTVSALLINASNGAAFKNFEALDLTTTGAAFTLDTALLTGSSIASLTLSGGGTGGVVANNVAANVGLTVVGSNTGSTTINVKNAATGTADALTITFAGEAATAAPAVATVKAGTIVANGIEAVSIVSAGGANTWNSVTLTDDKLKTVTISGDKNLDLAFGAGTGTNDGANGGAVNLIDGSAATGKLSINTANVVADNKAGVGLTVKGGSAADTITLVQKATVDAGAGDDTIISSLSGGTFTGGAGADKFDVAAAVAAGLTEATAVLSSITDFATTDGVKLLAGNTAFVSTKVALGGGVTTLESAIDAAATAAGVNGVAWFQYGVDTYVFANNGTVGFGVGDLVVKLAGTVDLSTATLNTTSDYLTL